MFLKRMALRVITPLPPKTSVYPVNLVESGEYFLIKLIAYKMIGITLPLPPNVETGALTVP